MKTTEIKHIIYLTEVSPVFGAMQYFQGQKGHDYKFMFSGKYKKFILEGRELSVAEVNKFSVDLAYASQGDIRRAIVMPVEVEVEAPEINVNLTVINQAAQPPIQQVTVIERPAEKESEKPASVTSPAKVPKKVLSRKAKV